MRYFLIINLMIVSSILTGCEPTREVLGFKRNSNDEFAVATTPPLTNPPDFTKLPEPIDQYSRSGFAQETTNRAKDLALSQLNHKAQPQSSNTSAAELDLLKNAKVSERDPSIRRKLAEEVKEEKHSTKSFVKDLLLIKKEKGDVIDPIEETERLKNAESSE